MARTEKDFLNTLETYVKITQDRLRDGRIIDAHDELGLIEVMIDQRRQEVEGTAAWESIREKALREMVEEQPCAPEIGEDDGWTNCWDAMPEKPGTYLVEDHEGNRFKTDAHIRFGKIVWTTPACRWKEIPEEQEEKQK